MSIVLVDDIVGQEFANYIGCREYSDAISTSGLWLDDYPNIGLVNAADAVDDLLTGKELIDKCIRSGITETIKHFVGSLSAKWTMKAIVRSCAINMAGNHTFYGENGTTEYIHVRTEIGYDFDLFKQVELKGFALVSDRAVVGKQFFVKTSAHTEQTMTIDLVEGKNIIPIHVNSQVEWVEIIFDVSDFKVGRREFYDDLINSSNCYDRCKSGDYQDIYYEIHTSTDRVTTTSLLTSIIGFNMIANEVTSQERVGLYFSQAIAHACYLNAAYFFFRNVKSSKRYNPFTVNSVEDIKDEIMALRGGVDPMSGMKVKGDYWIVLAKAVETAYRQIPDLTHDAFDQGGVYVANSLP